MLYVLSRALIQSHFMGVNASYGVGSGMELPMIREMPTQRHKVSSIEIDSRVSADREN
jgi:hypothetical protein